MCRLLRSLIASAPAVCFCGMCGHAQQFFRRWQRLQPKTTICRRWQIWLQILGMKVFYKNNCCSFVRHKLQTTWADFQLCLHWLVANLATAASWMSADSPSTLSCMMHRAEPTAWKPRSALSEGFFFGFVTGIHKDSVCRWNLWFPSAGVFAKALAGRATGTQITSPQWHSDSASQWQNVD